MSILSVTRLPSKNARSVASFCAAAGAANASIVAAANPRTILVSITAYGEGAYPLTSVIEAQRSAREAVRQYQDDLGALWTAQAAASLATVGGVLP